MQEAGQFRDLVFQAWRSIVNPSCPHPLNNLEIELSQETHLYTHIIYDLALTIVLRTFPRGDYTLPTHQNLRTPFPLFAQEIIPSLPLSLKTTTACKEQEISFHPL